MVHYRFKYLVLPFYVAAFFHWFRIVNLVQCTCIPVLSNDRSPVIEFKPDLLSHI